MKRILALILALTLSLSLAACGNTPSTEEEAPSSSSQVSTSPEQTEPSSTPESDVTENTEPESTIPAESSEPDTNILVAYFSWADNAILADDVDAVASPSVIAPGNVQQLAGWVQQQTGGDRPGSTAAEGCETAGCCGADCIKAAGRAAGGKQAERNRAECENPDRSFV